MRRTTVSVGGPLLAVCACVLLALLPALAAGPVMASNTDWAVSNPPGVFELRGVGALDADTAYAVGSNGTGDGVILKTADGGAGWEAQATFTGQPLYSVAAVDYYATYASGSGGLYRTFDSGATWETVYDTSSSGSQLVDVSAPDVSHVWSLMIDTTGNSSVLRSTDGGTTWVNVYTRPPSGGRLQSIAAVDENTAWAAGGSGPNGILVKTADKGVSWQEQPATGAPVLYDVSALDALTAWAAGGNGSDSGALYHTSDGGATWTATYTGDVDCFYGVDPVDGSTAWACGTGAGASQGIIMKTMDAGGSWQAQYAASGIYPCCAWSVNASIAWVAANGATGPSVLYTVNGGDTRPDLTGLTPDTGHEGDSITLNGSDFGSERGSSTVTFGGVEAAAYPSWSDSEIQATVPGGLKGRVAVVVNTAGGSSGSRSFLAAYPIDITSVDPDEGIELTISLNITSIKGSGFQQGATVRFETAGIVLNAYNVNVISESEISCTIGLFVAMSGRFDVIVTNPDGGEARLQAGFNVRPLCGAGAGTAAVALGGMVGMLSVGHRLGRRRRRRRGVK
jgi:photosystem II stability/assembly factor-like uncharacterized protein